MNNKGADWPAHPCSLVSAFVIRIWESIISKLAIVYVVDETGLSLALSETPKTGFVASRPIYKKVLNMATAYRPSCKYCDTMYVCNGTI